MAKYERLQGKEWAERKHTLTNVAYRASQNGHIKGFYTDENGTIYTHWLSDDEIKWYKLRKMIEDTILSVHIYTTNPDSEEIMTIKGALGRVLNMMDELEAKNNEK